MTPKEINQQLVIPPWDTASPVRTSEAEFLFRLIKEKHSSRTLEIGFAMGRSAAHILAASDAQHTAIDPFQDNYQQIGKRNLAALGLADRLTLIEELSHVALPELLRQDQRFDFVFIDGCHRFDSIFLDFYYADLLLDPGGLLVFHDSWMRSTQLVLSFVRRNRPDYRFIPCPEINMCVVQKVGRDARDGMHFKEFYTWRSWLRHHLGNWVANSPASPIKRMLLALKNRLRGLLS